jgi:hypothetical protein
MSGVFGVLRVRLYLTGDRRCGSVNLRICGGSFKLDATTNLQCQGMCGRRWKTRRTLSLGARGR